MKFSDHVDSDTKKAMYKEASRGQQKKPPPKKEEKLSFKDLERMMGKYDAKYERRGGAIRRK
jgi:hypothetical protein